MSLPRYPEYRDSGIAWIGQVPAHWNTPRLKTLLYETDERAGTTDAELLGLSKSLGVVRRSELDQGAAESNDYSKYKLVHPGQLVMNKMQAWNGVFGLSANFGMVSPDYATFRFYEPELGSYLSSLFRTDVVAGVCFTRCRGMGTAFLRINTGDFLDIKVPLPPPEEVQAIATFLDRETGKIDALIAEQEKLLDLLAEKRQATISHAVTRGLNPDAPTKDSGVAWLGEVPEHWTITRIKYVVEAHDGIQMGPFGGMLLDLDADDSGFKVYGQENTISGDFSRGTRWISEERFRELERYRVRTGDLVLTRKGSLGNARLVQELPQPGICDSDTIRVRVDEQLMRAEFFATLLHEADYVALQLAMTKRGAILSGVNTETISNLCVVVPPRCEQNEILESLSVRLAEYQSAEDSVSKAVALLKERRSALIAAAVTGQIDVRGLVTEPEAA